MKGRNSMTDLTTTQTEIAAALETFAADALDLDYLTLAELVTEATGFPCDTADLGAIADAGRFPAVGGAVLLATSEEKLSARIAELEAELAAVAGHGSPAPSTELWDAIHAFTRACGGDPDTGGYGNLTRQRAVVAVESAVAQLRATSRDSE
jgi:hypothetical protein